MRKYVKANAAQQKEIRDIWSFYLSWFMTALRKFPSVKTTVFRGRPIARADAEKTFWRGRRVTFAAFSSASRNFNGAAFRAEDGVTVLEINAFNAISLDGMSFFPEESECLVLPMTSFVITSDFREVLDVDSGNMVHVISLQEICGEELLT